MQKPSNQGLNLISGLDKQKQQLNECLILPNLRPDIFKGIRAPPKGILFFGPPGNGKTLLARAVSQECNCTFFNLSASILVSKFMGESEKLLKALFYVAYLKQPSIIYIDEIDCLLSERQQNDHEASRRLKTEFLVQMDGINTSDQDRVITIGTTNLPDSLDPAVLRRFTTKIYVPMPDQQTIQQILKDQLKEISNNITEKQIQQIAKNLQNYTCSDVKTIIKEASIQPLREINKQQILTISTAQIRQLTKSDFDKAIQNVNPSLSQKDIDNYNSFSKKMLKN